MQNKLSLPVSIIIAGLLIAGAIFLSNTKNPTKESPTIKNFEVATVTQDEHIKGSLSSEIIAIEYSDTECPFCKVFHKTMSEIVSERNDIAWVYRNFPLSRHPKAFKQAEALECAGKIGGNNSFWAYADRIFDITPSNNGLSESELPNIAEYIGLDRNSFEACLNSGEMKETVEEDITSGENAGAEGTPYTILLNQKNKKTTIIAGAQSKENVIKAIESIK